MPTTRAHYPLLSRLQLWYARYKPEIEEHFPKGYWSRYTLWQFASQVNCDEKSCPYRVRGAGLDIDVNVAAMSADELRANWPFGELVETDVDRIDSVSLPVARADGLNGYVPLSHATVVAADPVLALKAAFHGAGERYPDRTHSARVSAYAPLFGIARWAETRRIIEAYALSNPRFLKPDRRITGSIRLKQSRR